MTGTSHPVHANLLTFASHRNTLPVNYGGDMQKYLQHMRALKLSDDTIQARLEILVRLHDHLPVRLMDATPEMLIAFQSTYSHLAPASVDIYTRHVKALYAWAKRHGFIDTDPAEDLPIPHLRKGRPHPTTLADLTTILACSRGTLHIAYVLAAFAGLRANEICQLQGRDINRESGQAIALIHGKGGKERHIPFIPPVVTAIGYDRGWIITHDDGRPWRSNHLSAQSSKFIHDLGIQTTLHSMRHFFATNTMRLTHDPMFVRDLLGHESLSTTEIYMQSTLDGAHDRLAPVTRLAEGLLYPPLRDAVAS